MKRQRPFLIGLAWTLLLFCFLLSNVSCGRKAPPVPPKTIELPVVDKINSDLQGDNLRLTWSVPKLQGQQEEELAGFYVYRSKDKIGEEGCNGCPVRFERIAVIPYDKMSAMLKSEIVYPELLEKDYYYQYRITCYAQYGDEGAPSGVIRIDH